MNPLHDRLYQLRIGLRCASVAQLVRVLACHAGGRGFEPRHSRHFEVYLSILALLRKVLLCAECKAHKCWF